MFLPNPVGAALRRINKAGFSAYIVGGAVRDALLSRETNDYDVGTDARPSDIERIFKDRKIIDSGRRFGTVGVVLDGVKIEITTFRSEDSYSDGRRPNEVVFRDSPEQDLSRRDFTVNAVAYHPDGGFIDLFGGIDDARVKLIRAVGDAGERFAEDSLRILRAVRFSAELGFSVEVETEKAMFANLNRLAALSPERVRDEFSRFLIAGHVKDGILRYMDIWAAAVPELGCYAAPENKDILTRAASMTERAPRALTGRLAALFCGLSEITVREYHGDSPSRSLTLTENVLRRMRFPKRLAADTALLVKWYPAFRRNPNPSAARALGIFGERLIHSFSALLRSGTAVGSDDFSVCEAFEKDVTETLKSGCYSLKQLAVKGDDIKELGITGKDVGQTLRTLLNAVLAGHVENEKDALMKFAAG